MQVVNSQGLFSAREDGCDRIDLHGKYSCVTRQLVRPRLALYDLEGLTEQRDLLIVAFFLPRMLTVANDNRPVFYIEIGPAQQGDLLDAHRRFDSEVDDVAHRQRGARVEVVAQGLDFRLRRSSGPFLGLR